MPASLGGSFDLTSACISFVVSVFVSLFKGQASMASSTKEVVLTTDGVVIIAREVGVCGKLLGVRGCLLIVMGVAGRLFFSGDSNFSSELRISLSIIISAARTFAMTAFLGGVVSSAGFVVVSVLSSLSVTGPGLRLIAIGVAFCSVFSSSTGPGLRFIATG
ncbi:hypothetical protein FF38_03211 [Lucilia cuprina]|uniref:Uncharacterized protein n=1 Tax=Lucilia cuprina TaxID=7375 RepID=A0A0L0BP12_LUCCU|nr:hypothetical protein FF38_03211 [Lucilia cuprina]